jgi:hypothetical protein
MVFCYNTASFYYLLRYGAEEYSMEYATNHRDEDQYILSHKYLWEK